MKLNFWQWLGIVLLVVATALWIMRQRNEQKQAEFEQPVIMYSDPDPTTDPRSDPTTEPTTEPAAERLISPGE
ncbi:MAG TPA: hypothetical protein VGR35_13800 [Tepidisphaeraceae bacterium]|nr:hypothetical protein [Tepidisphaeraceae bacterium]